MRITAVKNLFRWLRRRKKIETNINITDIEMPKNKLRKMIHLTIEECEKIIEHIERTEKRKDTRMRNILLFKIGFNVGLRKEEMLNLRVSDLKRELSFEII